MIPGSLFLTGVLTETTSCQLQALWGNSPSILNDHIDGWRVEEVCCQAKSNESKLCLLIHMYVCHGICWEAILEPSGLGFCNKDSYGCHCSGGKCWKSWKIRWRKCNAGMHRKCWRTHNSHPTCKSIHVSKPCHENGPKSKNDDWKPRTWQWSLWNPLEPQRCVSSWPHSKHFQKVEMVTQNDRKKPNLRYKNHSKYSPMDSHGIVALKMGTADSPTVSKFDKHWQIESRDQRRELP